MQPISADNKVALYSGYYNYAGLSFLLIGAIVALPGLLMAAPIITLFVGIKQLGHFIETQIGEVVKKYAMYGVFIVMAQVR